MWPLGHARALRDLSVTIHNLMHRVGKTVKSELSELSMAQVASVERCEPSIWR